MNATTLDSKITAVTVFSDRAQITRQAKLPLAAGEHVLLFTGLPQRLDTNSIQVNGSGGGVLHDIKCTHQYRTRSPHAQVEARRKELEGFEGKLREVKDHIGRIGKERQFIENIAATLTHSGDEPNNYRLEPDRWIKMVDFYRERLTALDAEQRGLEISKREWEGECRRIEKHIADLDQGGTPEQEYQVELSVSNASAGDITLSLQYMVYGPSWYPVYDLRVDSIARQLALNYMAMVQQSTGEDWEDAALQLSTAQAHIGGEQPQLSPWRVNEWTPPPPAAAPKMAKRLRKPGNKDDAGADEEGGPFASRAVSSELLMQEQDPFAGPAPAPMAVPTASVVASATAVEFVIPGNKTIKSDNEPHRVTVLMERFPAHFNYVSVPKLAAHAYLKAKIKNTSHYPLLAGTTQIFLDNRFVAKGEMEFIAPGEEFSVSLGVDAAMKVEYQMIRRLKKQTGLVNKAIAYEYEYRMTITNNKPSAEDIAVWDQIPISSHEKVQVQLIEPDYRSDSNEFKKNELNYLEWNYQLKAGEKRVIPLSYVVEHPLGMRIEGL